MKTMQVTEEEKSSLKTLMENAPNNRPLSIAEVRQSIKLIDVIESTESELNLEDADHAFLLERFKAMQFIRADRSVLALFDKVEKA